MCACGMSACVHAACVHAPTQKSPALASRERELLGVAAPSGAPGLGVRRQVVPLRVRRLERLGPDRIVVRDLRGGGRACVLDR